MSIDTLAQQTRSAQTTEDIHNADTTPAVEPASRHRWYRKRNVVFGLLRKPGLLICLVYVVFVVVSALWPQWFTTYRPYDTDPQQAMLAPSLHHLFGTDTYGRDLWTRVLYGSALTIKATVVALALALVAGLGIGVLAGFCGGFIDAVLMRGIDVLLAIPGLLLALSIVTALGYGTMPVAVAVGVAIVPGFARTTRAEVLRVKTLPYIEAARAGGSSWWRILLRHILPNSWGPVAVLAVLDAGVAIIAIATLSFLGLGAAPPAAEWGTLIADGRDYLVTSWWLSLLPSVFVALLVLALNHISKTVQETSR